MAQVSIKGILSKQYKITWDTLINQCSTHFEDLKCTITSNLNKIQKRAVSKIDSRRNWLLILRKENYIKQIQHLIKLLPSNLKF